ncbi:rod shape-determining protein RodA [bacterium]|nr:rod shape-determining protein RodA [bacterium]
MIDRRLLINFDWLLLLTVLLICSIGIVLIYSATSAPHSQIRQGLHLKQAYWIGIGLVVMLLIISIDYHLLARWSPFLYILNLSTLGYILYTGNAGVERWIRCFGMNLQPSEFTKLCIILLLAQFFKDKKPSEIGFKECIFAFALTFMPFIMILKQPDLGTALLLIPILFAILFISGIRVRWLFGIMFAGLTISPVLWFVLKPYQKNRILSFINPNLDPLGAGYQVIQSKIAVGSGGILGQGLLRGTQCRLKFIPQHHTDFIFSLLAEEFGFIGSFITLALFLFLILKGLDICANSKDRLGTILSYSIVISLLFHIVVNAGMVIGIMPVTGIPLPFISYGGSAMAGNFLAIGLLLNIKMRRFD